MANIEHSRTTTKTSPRTGFYSVDSLKLKIPLDKVKVLDQTLMDKVAKINTTTGEYLNPDPETWKREALQGSRVRGISTYYKVTDLLKDKGQQETYLVILINSKLIKELYFSGITNDTLQLVYDSIIDQGVVFISYDTFINGTCTDTDIKVDFRPNATPDDFDTFTEILVKRSKSSAMSEKGYQRKNDQDNKGIQFGKRESTMFKGSPFLKFYHKELELIYHSYDFSNQFLKDIDYSNTIRVEVTIKNKAHFRHHKIEDTTLKNIVSLSQDKMKSIFINAYEKHFEFKSTRIINTDKLTPMDKVLCKALISKMEDRGLTFPEVKNYYLHDEKDSQAKYRLNKKFDQIYQIGIMETEVGQRSKKWEDLLRDMGMI